MENKTKSGQKIKRIAVCAIMVALATILSMLPIFKAPLGGSVTLGSMVPIMLISFLYGWSWGIPVAIGYAVIQLLISLSEVASWGLSPAVFIGCLALDYILAYSVICVCNIFGSKKMINVILGILVAGILRLLCHFISGVLFFGQWAEEGFNAYTWAIAYNGAFLLPEIAICIVVMCILYRFFPKFREI